MSRGDRSPATVATVATVAGSHSELITDANYDRWRRPNIARVLTMFSLLSVASVLCGRRY